MGGMMFDVTVTPSEATYDIDGEPPDGAMVALITPVAAGMSEPIEAQHLTLMYLGKADQIDATAREVIVSDVAAAVGASGLPALVANGAGYLGPNHARVVFAETAPSEDPDHVRLSSFRDEIAFTAERDLTGSSALDGVVRHDPFLAHITTGYDGDLLEIEPGTPIPVKGVRVAFGTEIYDITVTGSTVEASAKTGIGVLDALTVRAGALLSELSDRISAVETTRGFRA